MIEPDPDDSELFSSFHEFRVSTFTIKTTPKISNEKFNLLIPVQGKEI